MSDEIHTGSLDALNEMLYYEVNASQRYRRYASLLLISGSHATESSEETISARKSDARFAMPEGAAWLLPETRKAGALVAARRFLAGARQAGETGLNAAIVSFPDDGFSADELRGTLDRRFKISQSTPGGNIVAYG